MDCGIRELTDQIVFPSMMSLILAITTLREFHLKNIIRHGDFVPQIDIWCDIMCTSVCEINEFCSFEAAGS